MDEAAEMSDNTLDTGAKCGYALVQMLMSVSRVDTLNSDGWRAAVEAAWMALSRAPPWGYTWPGGYAARGDLIELAIEDIKFYTRWRRPKPPPPSSNLSLRTIGFPVAYLKSTLTESRVGVRGAAFARARAFEAFCDALGMYIDIMANLFALIAHACRLDRGAAATAHADSASAAVVAARAHLGHCIAGMSTSNTEKKFVVNAFDMVASLCRLDGAVCAAAFTGGAADAAMIVVAGVAQYPACAVDAACELLVAAVTKTPQAHDAQRILQGANDALLAAEAAAVDLPPRSLNVRRRALGLVAEYAPGAAAAALGAAPQQQPPAAN